MSPLRRPALHSICPRPFFSKWHEKKLTICCCTTFIFVPTNFEIWKVSLLCMSVSFGTESASRQISCLYLFWPDSIHYSNFKRRVINYHCFNYVFNLVSSLENINTTFKTFFMIFKIAEQL